VEDGGSAPQRLQRTYAADAQQDLLPDPHLPVPAVEGGGDLARAVRVPPHVAVEQVEGRAPDVDAPHPGPHRLPADVDLDLHGGAVLADLHGDRHVVPVVVGVKLLLPPVERQDLPEVPLLVQEPHADERHPQVGRGLQVVAGEDAEPARIDREPLVDPELAGEVRGLERALPAVGFREPGGALQVLLEGTVDPLHVGDEALVPGRGDQVGLRNGPQHLDGVLVRLSQGAGSGG
jgi:hypothetical protein